MKSKNTICLWFDKDALDAARFYAQTFPNSEVTAVHKAPADYPNGKAGMGMSRTEEILAERIIHVPAALVHQRGQQKIFRRTGSSAR